MDLKDILRSVVDASYKNSLDGTTMKNILLFINGGDVPESLESHGHLINPVVANEIDICTRMAFDEHGIELTDEQFESMIDGELYEFYTNEYVSYYFSVNKELIDKYVELWDSTKTFLEVGSE